MAKDPAILWYWNDWNGGTSTFTRHLKGCYIDLLSSQFNSGRLSLLEIKTVLGADFGLAWPTLQKKFRKDENEMYYNERMEQEQEKRKKFTDGRRKNLLSKKPKIPHKVHHMGKSMGGHVDNENEDEIDNEIPEGSAGEGHSVDPIVFYDAEQLVLANQIRLEEICMATNKIDFEEVKISLRKFHLHLEEKEKYPMTKKQIFAGFEKWLMNEKNFTNGSGFNRGNPDKQKLGTSDARTEGLKKWGVGPA